MGASDKTVSFTEQNLYHRYPAAFWEPHQKEFLPSIDVHAVDHSPYSRHYVGEEDGQDKHYQQSPPAHQQLQNGSKKTLVNTRQNKVTGIDALISLIFVF